MENGIIQIYYGKGIGKTSAALGTSVRRAGKGDSVIIIPFLKGELDTDYLQRLEPEVKTFRFERSPESFSELSKEEQDEEKKNIMNGLAFAKKVLCTGECDLLVLDEVLGIVSEGIATEDEILELLSAKSPLTSVILTGKELSDGIREKADLVMNIVAE
ncbi:MAG: cob(I)yrinic acid a,c-diamide adenosyltransferase [Lachnospiraceae bacterium]|nr:cob(I)yrinic acid a,c-diamide adenosyltransferase [Lachnospiraceae bacterium]